MWRTRRGISISDFEEAWTIRGALRERQQHRAIDRIDFPCQSFNRAITEDVHLPRYRLRSERETMSIFRSLALREEPPMLTRTKALAAD